MNTACIRREPLAGFPSLDRLFGTVLAEPVFHGNNSEDRPLPLDISETENEVIVRASLPGFTADQVDIQVHQGVLTIKAEREEQTEETTERYYRRERRLGSVSRRIALPDTVHDADAKADLTNGELTLRLAKEPKAQPRKINIG